MTVKPDKVYHVNYVPESDGFDLRYRVYGGYSNALRDGIDWCFVIENDDYYPPDYFEKYLNAMSPEFGHDLIGDYHTLYYNIRNRSYKHIKHSGRASLFTTALRTKMFYMESFWNFKSQFLDIDIWNTHQASKRAILTGAIGIKHGIGLCGGKGHNMVMRPDAELQYLKDLLQNDNEAFEFYRSLSEELYKP